MHRVVTEYGVRIQVARAMIEYASKLLRSPYNNCADFRCVSEVNRLQESTPLVLLGEVLADLAEEVESRWRKHYLLREYGIQGDRFRRTCHWIARTSIEGSNRHNRSGGNVNEYSAEARQPCQRSWAYSSIEAVYIKWRPRSRAYMCDWFNARLLHCGIRRSE
jgi:hypothetical protein